MVDSFREDVSNTLRILVATDCHLGYLEKDEVRGQDPFESFDEIFSIAEQKKVDFVLLGGNLFHENKPSNSTLVKAIEILRRHCLSSQPVKFQVVSDHTVNFTNAFGHVNNDDPHFSVGLPVFSIHGNHDGPDGVDNLSAVDILSACSLLNYFGKMDLGDLDVGHITLCPILIRKGSTSIALYGLGNIRDEWLNSMLQTPDAVQWMRPEAEEGRQITEWFNILVLHQNRANTIAKNAINQLSLPKFLNFIVWGHEHECLADPQEVPEMSFHVTQPGSSVATSLVEGETKPKHVLLLEIKGIHYLSTKIPLTSVRPFEYIEVLLKNESDINPDDKNSILDHLDKVVKDLIEKSNQRPTVKTDNMLPLVRVKVDYSGFMSINTQRFGQKYVGKVANPHDILTFSQASRKGRGEGKIDSSEGLGPEELNQHNIEALVAETNLKMAIRPINDLAPSSEALKTTGGLGRAIFSTSPFFRSAADSSSDESPTTSDDFDESLKGHYEEFFVQINKISAGGYGAVFKCRHSLEGKMYAVKKVGYNLRQKEFVLNEVKIHSQLDHPNILRYYHCWMQLGWHESDLYSGSSEVGSDKDEDALVDPNATDHTLYIQMELCARSLGDLFDSCRLSASKSWDYFHQIVEALYYIHMKGIIHADLSKANILIGTDGKIKVGDFGLAKNLHVGLKGKGSEEGNKMYQAPEMVRGEILGDYTDTYSLGLLLVELVHSFQTVTERSKIFGNLRANGTSTWGSSILYRMLDPSPSIRPSMAEILDISDEAGIEHCTVLKSLVAMSNKTVSC